MKRISLSTVAVALGISLAIPLSAFATNGYFAIGYGQKSKGMGGASIAFPQDALVAASNPAGMARIGSRMDVGVDAFVPPRRVSGIGYFQLNADNVKSTDNFFPIPGFGINFDVDERMSWGLSFVGNGANTHYTTNFFELTGVARPYGELGVELIQAQLFPTVAYKLNETQAVGISPVIGIQVFKAYGLGNFGTPGVTDDFQFSSDDSKLTNNGQSWSYGAGLRLGWLGSFFNDKLSLGAAYGTKVYMSRFKQYSGLFAENGDFDIPENYAVGAAFKATPKLTFAADIQRVNYSNVKSVGNRHPTTSINDICTRPIDADPAGCMAGNTPQPSSSALGAENGWGFGWTDQTAYKLGLNYVYNKKWTFRAGYNYGKSPVPDDQLLFNMLAPAITEQFYTVGATYNLYDVAEINVSFVRAPKSAQTCVAPACKTMFSQEVTPSGTPQFVAVELEYYALGVAFAMKF